MRHPFLLTYHLARQFAVWLFIMSVGFIILIGMVSFAEMLGQAEKSNDGAAVAFQYVLYNIPNSFLDYLPFIALFAATLCLSRLNRLQQIAVMKASGISTMQILTPLLLVALLFGSLLIAFGNPLGASGRHLYDLARQERIGVQRQFVTTGSGIWIREDRTAQPYIIRAQETATDKNIIFLRNVTLLMFSEKNDFLYQAKARQALLKDGYWTIQNAEIIDAETGQKRKQALSIPTPIQANDLQNRLNQPDAISIWDLPERITIARNTGNLATDYIVRFQSLISIPILMMAMVLIAASFSLESGRMVHFGRNIGWAIISGFGLFVLKSLAANLGKIGYLPIYWSIWAPIGIAVLIGLTLLIIREEEI